MGEVSSNQLLYRWVKIDQRRQQLEQKSKYFHEGNGNWIKWADLSDTDVRD